MSDKPETARECAERLVGVRWTPKSGWPTEVEFLTGNLVDSITSALEERERERDHLRMLAEKSNAEARRYLAALSTQVRGEILELDSVKAERDTLKAERDRLAAIVLANLPGDYDAVCFERNTLKVQLAEAVRQVGEVVSALENCERHVGLLGGESAKLRAAKAFLARVKGSEGKEGAS